VNELKGKDRLIVALDVPTVKEALALVETLDNVYFFKIGLQLFLTGHLPKLLKELRQKQVFLDLKVPGDIGNTIAAVMNQCIAARVHFLTLSESMPLPAITAAKTARDATGNQYPKLLMVPFLSSLGAEDLNVVSADEHDLDTFILKRAHGAIEAGCDGLIASGDAISLCRKAFPNAIIVSPGVRPTGSSTDDHKRHTTPGEAIRRGADYLVVGRPIRNAANPREAAARIIAEIDTALNNTGGGQGGGGPLHASPYPMVAKSHES
jgi:orotidine-5'-phosphate decarboxylase